MIAGKIGNGREAVEQLIQSFLQKPAVRIELEFDEVGDVYHMRGLLCGMLNLFQTNLLGGHTNAHLTIEDTGLSSSVLQLCQDTR